MPRRDFRTTVTSLWIRLVALWIIGLVFAEALGLAQGEVQGWTFYLTTTSVIFEVVVRLVAAALAGAEPLCAPPFCVPGTAVVVCA